MKSLKITLLITILLITGCTTSIHYVSDDTCTISKFHYGIERVDYAENISGVPPKNLCVLDTKIIDYENDSIECFRCKNTSRAVMIGYVDNGVWVCPI